MRCGSVENGRTAIGEAYVDRVLEACGLPKKWPGLGKGKAR